MTDRQRLDKLLQAEKLLKQTKKGYSPTGPFWKRAMPLLWEVRESLAGDMGLKLAKAHGLLKETVRGYDPRGSKWRPAMALIDQVQDELAAPKVPVLGPSVAGDKSVMLFAPTHNTDGLVGYPAFDSGWQAGRRVLAVERLKVTRQSSAAGADAFYATGVSGIDYWYGHIVQAPATGSWFDKGDQVGTIARIAASQGGPHLHLGLNTVRLIGHTLAYGRTGHGPDYTMGSPTIGVQLTKALST
jgi:hypothetical protein